MVLGSILAGAAGGASVEIIIRATDQFSKVMKDAEGKSQSLTKSVMSSSIAWAAVGTAVAAFGVTVVKNYLEAENAARSFSIALGEQADEILPELRKQTQGMVSDLVLMQSASRAVALGIKEDDLPGLFEAAASRAKLMGISVEQAVGDISLGIGRQSKMILDNLGIIVNLDSAYSKYAKTLNKTADELSDSEKKQALTNAVMEASALTVAKAALENETYSDSWKEVTASVTNFITKIGEEIAKVKESRDIIVDYRLGILDLKKEMDFEGVRLNLQTQMDELAKLEEAVNKAESELISIRNVIDKLMETPFQGERQAQLEMNALREQERLAQINVLEAENTVEKEKSQEALDKIREDMELLRLKTEEVYDIEREKAGIVAKIPEDLEKGNIKQGTLVGLVSDQVNNWIRTKEELKEITKPDGPLDKMRQQVQDMTDEFLIIEKIFESIRTGKISITEAEEALISRGLLEPDKNVKDFIIRPNGEIIQTDPMDTIIGTKNPESLMKGGQGIVVNIGTIQGMDPDAVAEALQSRLSTLISV